MLIDKTAMYSVTLYEVVKVLFLSYYLVVGDVLPLYVNVRYLHFDYFNLFCVLLYDVYCNG